MSTTLQGAFPDIGEVTEEIREEGDRVVSVGHFAGTYSNDFDLSAVSMGVIPATGAAVKFPSNTLRVSFDGAKIAEIHSMATGPDAGFAGFLKAVGAPMG